MATTQQPDNYGFGRATGNNPTSVNSAGSSTGVQTGTSASNTTSTGTSNTSSNRTSTTTNLDPATVALLQRLIGQLAGGGTPDMRRQQGVRDAERGVVSNIREGYSKPNAFLDAAGLIAQQTRRTMEALLPSINRAAEDAGSSGGALRALLMQDVANKAAESSSALGVQTAVNYGNISAGLSQVMERLTAVDPAAAQLLIGAIGQLRGAVSTTTETGTGTTTNTGSQTTTGSNTVVNTGTTNDSRNIDYKPIVTTPIAFGGGVDTGQLSNDLLSRISTDRALAGMTGNTSPWDSYRI